MTNNTPYIGVGLDGTLAHHERETFAPIGEPIPLTVERVKAVIAAGHEVRIFTARCVTLDCAGNPLFDIVQVRAIEDWCEKHIGQKLKVQYWKDCGMKEIWDDRAIQFIPNTGSVLLEHYDRLLAVATKLVNVTYRVGGAPLELIGEMAGLLGITPSKVKEKSRIITASSIPKRK